jgi:molecular chaperone GrpE (heat shock protein)
VPQFQQLIDVCTKMGMTDYFGVQGETFNFARHEKVGEESSSDIKAGAVISCSTKGMEVC